MFIFNLFNFRVLLQYNNRMFTRIFTRIKFRGKVLHEHFYPTNKPKKLRLCYHIAFEGWDQFQNIDFPPNLTYLDYNGPLCNPLPKTLESLTLYDEKINGIEIYKFIPTNLKKLYLLDYYSWWQGFKFDANKLANFIKNIPSSVDYIEIANFDGPLNLNAQFYGHEIDNFMRIYKSDFHHSESHESIYFIRKGKE